MDRTVVSLAGIRWDMDKNLSKGKVPLSQRGIAQLVQIPDARAKLPRSKRLQHPDKNVRSALNSASGAEFGADFGETGLHFIAHGG
jgi:hypothetical protein